MTNVPQVKEVAAQLRQAQPDVEQKLNDVYGAFPAKLRAERAAYELRCLLYEGFEDHVSFSEGGAYLQPTVMAVQPDNEMLENSPLKASAPHLWLVFNAQDSMAKAIAETLSKLSELGVTERPTLEGEMGQIETLFPALCKKFKYQGFPVVYGPVTMS